MEYIFPFSNNTQCLYDIFICPHVTVFDLRWVSQRASDDGGRSRVLYTMLKSFLSKAVCYLGIMQQVDLIIGECT